MTAAHAPRGRLVAVEGIDGSGKSTLARRLSARLRERGWPVTLVSEPSHGRLAGLARAEAPSDPWAAAMLFTLDRIPLQDRVRKLLGAPGLVLSDRTFYSTLAYQGALFPPQARVTLRRLEEAVAVPPDLVLWLDGPVELSLRRLGQRPGGADGIEKEHFQQKVRREYRRLARENPRTFVRLGFERPLGALLAESVSLLESRWPELCRAR